MVVNLSRGDDDDEDVSIPQQGASAKELELLRSVMGDTEEPNDIGFFIDTRGRNDEPDPKRRRDANTSL
jgi:hypothetical protein